MRIKKKTNMKQLTGGELLNYLLINGELADPYKEKFTTEEIYQALLMLRKSVKFPLITSIEFERPLTARQHCCAVNALECIVDNDFNMALHEFQDCIEDCGKGINREITTNELVLYSCILGCFIEKLEQDKSKQK